MWVGGDGGMRRLFGKGRPCQYLIFKIISEGFLVFHLTFRNYRELSWLC